MVSKSRTTTFTLHLSGWIIFTFSLISSVTGSLCVLPWPTFKEKFWFHFIPSSLSLSLINVLIVRDQHSPIISTYIIASCWLVCLHEDFLSISIFWFFFFASLEIWEKKVVTRHALKRTRRANLSCLLKGVLEVHLQESKSIWFFGTGHYIHVDFKSVMNLFPYCLYQSEKSPEKRWN